MYTLTDPPPNSAISHGITWVQHVALGTAATIVAVIAVATIGLLMMSGRLELRRGITIVLGCFILFGASGIAAALTGSVGSNRWATTGDAGQLSRQLRTPALPPSVYDPYAGASVPNSR